MTTDYASTRGHLIAALVFGLVALPQVLALTRSTGRLQFSDSGRIAYALKVNRYPKLWVGKPPGSGTPVNPIEVLASSPVTFVFPLDKPSRTYPVWAEPSHWYEGMKPRFDVADQIRGLRRSVMIDFGIAAKVLIPLLIIWLLRDRRSRTRHRILIAISALVLIAYAFLHSEARLIGLWLVLGITSVLAGTSLDRRSPRGRVASALVHAITVISSISFITYVADQIYTAGPGKAMHNAPHLQWKVARTLGSLGVARGSRVALVGDDSDIYWARLSGVQVAVQIPLSEATRYWQMPAESRSQLEQRIAGTGAAAIVASWTSPAAPLPGWIPVEGTRYSILPLDRNEPTQ